MGTLSNDDDDDDGSENVAKNEFCVPSNLIASIWTRSTCQMLATFLGVEFLRILFRFKKRKEIRRLMSTSCIKRQIRRFHVVVVEWTSKKCSKERDPRAELLFWSLNLLFFEVVVVVIVVVVSSLISPGCESRQTALQYIISSPRVARVPNTRMEARGERETSREWDRGGQAWFAPFFILPKHGDETGLAP